MIDTHAALHQADGMRIEHKFARKGARISCRWLLVVGVFHAAILSIEINVVNHILKDNCKKTVLLS